MTDGERGMRRLPQNPIFLSFMVEYWFCFECGVVFGGVAFEY